MKAIAVVLLPEPETREDKPEEQHDSLADHSPFPGRVAFLPEAPASSVPPLWTWFIENPRGRRSL